jgi:putative transposase
MSLEAAHDPLNLWVIKRTRTAFLRGGIEAIQRDPKRKRSRRVLTKELEQRILDTTLKTKPPDGTHWSVRGMAQRLGVSRMLVQRVWQRFDVQPHRVERFKLSNDPHFDEKVRDVVGLYLDPPDQALVLCVDEKSQIQPWIARVRYCRYVRACRNGRRTTTKGMEPRRCLPPSIS